MKPALCESISFKGEKFGLLSQICWYYILCYMLFTLFNVSVPKKSFLRCLFKSPKSRSETKCWFDYKSQDKCTYIVLTTFIQDATSIRSIIDNPRILFPMVVGSENGGEADIHSQSPAHKDHSIWINIKRANSIFVDIPYM